MWNYYKFYTNVILHQKWFLKNLFTIEFLKKCYSEFPFPGGHRSSIWQILTSRVKSTVIFCFYVVDNLTLFSPLSFSFLNFSFFFYFGNRREEKRTLLFSSLHTFSSYSKFFSSDFSLSFFSFILFLLSLFSSFNSFTLWTGLVWFLCISTSVDYITPKSSLYKNRSVTV